MRRVVAGFVLIAACAADAFSWGEDGHRIVCRIAYQTLTPDERQEVDRLVGGFQTPPDMNLKINSFPDACVFPDEARSKARAAVKAGDTDSPWLQYHPYKSWHFLNVDRSVKTIPEEACAGNCVLTGIATHADMLKSGETDQERAEGLVFLGHWVGDAHQPLHVSYSDDEGGNEIEPVTGGYYPVPKSYPLNLHAVWDSGILRKLIAKPGWRAFADTLQSEITDEESERWLAAAPLDWAQESYDITTQPAVKYCRNKNGKCVAFGSGRKLTKTYQKQFADDVEERLKKAGARLAASIRHALQQHSH